MKKLIAILLLIITLFSSCASHSGRVCGGVGGRRCVEHQKIENVKQANTQYKIS
ncbi:MAG: hypothetical protein H7239_08680 [Flavobacterium sp.]|nr:hypothetical protein [Flavobacterium sp.]